ncbi:LbtU family siderophore porin [Robiginitomaculum antarcticum]|uniref:LbtU family siderophore porin n=1 Tax=Robiginitomaculum antarcticum TaxID=437507 RepID=UPI00039C0CF0|nr:LbtU family siderophore porin [Robiginitomaculum antarcticum]
MIQLSHIKPAMKRSPLKTLALCSAAVAALTAPALAGQSAMALRGHWNPQTAAVPANAVAASQAYYSGEIGCNAYTPCQIQTDGTQTPYSSGQAAVDAGHYAPSGYPPQGPSPQGSAQYSGQTQPAPTRLNIFGLRGRKAAPAYAAPQYAYNDTRFDVGGVTVRTSAAHTDRMLDWQENTTGKTVTLLQHRRNGVLAPNSLYIGAGIKGGFMYQQTENPGQFPLLSRFPDFTNRTDDRSGVFAINNAALAITSTFGDWTTIYLQPEYSETEFKHSQDEFQLRKAYVTFGNLDRTPFYAAFGRKTIDFGNFDGYNPFTQTEAQHYFWAVADQPVLELGFYKNGLKASVSAFSGGRQLRTAFADEENNIQNYAASVEKEFLFNNGGALTFGASYLHDTIYRDNFTAHTFQDRQTGTPPANFINYPNAAASAFVEYNHPYIDLMVEYTSTLEPWAAAIPQAPDGTVVPEYVNADGSLNFDEKLSVLVAQARIKPTILGKVTPISLVTSFGNISDSDYVGTNGFGGEVTFDENQQHVIGIERHISEYIDFGAEYVFNKGFIPFVAPQVVSNADTEAHAVNIGFKARF